MPLRSRNFALILLILFCNHLALDTAEGKQRTISKLSKIDNPKRNRVVRQDNTNSSEESFFLPDDDKELTQRIKYLPFQMPTNYNKFQIPSKAYVLAVKGKDLPSFLFTLTELLTHPISVTLRIQDISDLSEIDEDITFSMDMILAWTDYVILVDGMERFNVSEEETDKTITDPLFKTLDQEFLQQIWKPDLFIEGLVKVTHPEIMTRPVTVRLNEVTGEVIYVARLRVRMECEMDFHYYPADTQNCGVEFRSHSYSQDEITIDWADPNGLSLEDCGGPNFDFQLTEKAGEDYHLGYVGNTTRIFSGLQFKIMARRKLSYHMVQTYLPSLFFIIITWLCFLVPATMVEARIGIAMTTLLTLTAMFASVRESSPTVSYVRAIDIWMVVCIFFVFLTLLEFTVLLWLRSASASEEKNNESPDTKTEETNKKLDPDCDSSTERKFVGDVEYKPVSQGVDDAQKSRHFPSAHKVALFIERFAFLTFSLLFLVFNFVYWSWLLVGSGYLKWEVDPDLNYCDN